MPKVAPKPKTDDPWLGKTFWLRFRVGPDPDKVDPADAWSRVKKFLKYILRAYGLVSEGMYDEEDADVKVTTKRRRR